MAPYQVFYPSGTVRRSGVIVFPSTPEFDEYLAWLALNNGPDIGEDPPPPPQILVGIGKFIAAVQQAMPDHLESIANDYLIASDDNNLTALCQNLGISTEQLYAVFLLAQNQGQDQGAAASLSLNVPLHR